MKFNNLLTMQDLFMNPELVNVLPQFGDPNVQNVMSGAEIKRRVKDYLRGFLGGGTDIDGGLQIKGSKPQTIAKIREISTTIEQFFNAVPFIGRNLRNNTRLYTPFASVAQLRDMTDQDAKLYVMRVVIDNINFNDNFGSLNMISKWDMTTFAKQKTKWEKEVGLWQRL